MMASELQPMEPMEPMEPMVSAPTAAGRSKVVDTDLLCNSDVDLDSDVEFEETFPNYERWLPPPVDPKFSQYIHHPLDPEAAEVIAKAKRPCLKPPEKRQYNVFCNEDGNSITVESCEDLVTHMTWKGHWELVICETYRTARTGPARSYVMEFVVPRNGNDLAPYEKEIKLAGYTHWSLCSHNGWEPFTLPRKVNGWGKQVMDCERLAEWHAKCVYRTPMPHHAGDGWLCGGKHYTKAEYHRANQHGPLGDTGPAWATFV